ncbi:MAG: 30S ribosomal protein S17 [Deltaproteobacteria bacterium]|nr:30S ribosomal protein S17 [Deltaproteobacteria bacterium]
MERFGYRKILIGTVISDKMDKTISVEVKRRVMHPKYKKFLIKRSVFKVHDEKNEAKVGDTVMFRETRPLSKTKRFKLVKIVMKGKRFDVENQTV